MHSRFKRLTSLAALLLALAIGQMYLPVSFAGPGGSVSTSPQQATAILTTGSNNPVMVNGASAITGATVMTGAGIETPDQVGATINLPGHFSLEISPNSKVTVDFDINGMKVTVIKGCVVLHTKKGTIGEIDTSNGVAAKADGSKDARLEICDPTIAAAPAAAAAGTGGLGQTGGVLIGAAGMGAALLIPILGGGRNPSPSL